MMPPRKGIFLSKDKWKDLERESENPRLDFQSLLIVLLTNVTCLKVIKASRENLYRPFYLDIYFFQEGSGQWVSLDAELVMRDGEVVGTKNPTGDSLLIDCRFELPFGKSASSGYLLMLHFERKNYFNSV